MDAVIHTLFESGFYRVLDFKCRCTDCLKSKPEYSENFSISFVRKGNFLFNVFRNSLDSYTGCVLINKPGAERTVTHVHTVPDECTIFDFKKDFYRELLLQYGTASFFRNPDLHSTLVKTNPKTEFLHFYIRELIERRAARLETDQLVLQMVGMILEDVTDCQPDKNINANLKKNHLATIENAKDYITRNFTSDISLSEIAAYCHVSPFHFSRIFKIFTDSSPHRFLLLVRLQHAAIMLRNSSLPVSDIAFLSGFNSIEHFTAAFRQQFDCSPGKYREEDKRQIMPPITPVSE